MPVWRDTCEKLETGLRNIAIDSIAQFAHIAKGLWCANM